MDIRKGGGGGGGVYAEDEGWASAWCKGEGEV